MDNFYVTLPSNVQSFSQNTVSNYKTKLASRLILTDDWEVGLVEISYTLSWYNVSIREPIHLMIWDKGKAKQAAEKIHLPEGRYDTIKQLIDVLNERLKKSNLFEYKPGFEPTFEYEERDRLVTLSQGVLKTTNKVIFLELSDNLCNILGFNKKYMISKNAENLLKQSEIENKLLKKGVPVIFDEPDDNFPMLVYTAEKPCELSGGYHSLFVYSDIVSPSFVGDSYTQLLRLVEIPSNYKFGDQIKITYPNTYYVPVLVKEFDTIEIDIKDDTGVNIPFQFGRSIIILHFRKVYKRSDNFFL